MGQRSCKRRFSSNKKDQKAEKKKKNPQKRVPKLKKEELEVRWVIKVLKHHNVIMDKIGPGQES